MTLVLQRRDTLNPQLNPQSETVGVRIPDSPFIVDLAQSFDKPLALTSANVSNEQSTLSVEVSVSHNKGPHPTTYCPLYRHIHLLLL